MAAITLLIEMNVRSHQQGHEDVRFKAEPLKGDYRFTCNARWGVVLKQH